MFVTAIVVILTAAFAVQSIVGISPSVAAAGLVKALVFEGEWWRLGTAPFLHIHTIHLLANATALYTFGRSVEERAGWQGLALVYVVSGLSGSAASTWLVPATSVGASGAILGVVACSGVFSYRSARDADRATLGAAGRVLIGTLLTGAVLYWIVDNAAHVGGAIAGAAAGLWLLKVENEARPHGVIVAGGVLGVVLILAGASWTSFRLLALPRDNRPPAVSQITDHRPVPEVTVTIRPWPGLEGVEYTVTNVSRSAIAAWEVGFYADEGTRRVASVGGDTCRAIPTRPGWLRPGQTFTESFRSISGTSRHELTAKVDVALIDGAGYSGSASRYAAMLEGRRHLAQELTAMATALEGVVDLPADEALRSLTAAVDERTSEAERTRQPLHITELMTARRLAEQQHPRLREELTRLARTVRRSVQVLATCDPRSADGH